MGSYDTSAKGIKADGTVEINGGSIMVHYWDLVQKVESKSITYDQQWFC